MRHPIRGPEAATSRGSHVCCQEGVHEANSSSPGGGGDPEVDGRVSSSGGSQLHTWSTNATQKRARAPVDEGPAYGKDRSRTIKVSIGVKRKALRSW